MQESEDSVLGEKERRVNFMDVPMSWMKEYAPVTADIKDFIEDITLSGSKVEGYTTVAGEIKNVVTGYIKEIVKHPDADKLVICKHGVREGYLIERMLGAVSAPPQAD